MKLVESFTAILIVGGALALSGCHKQKPVVLLPQEPPSATSAEQPPFQQQPQATQEPPAQQPPATGQDQTAANKTAPPAKTPAKHPHHATTSPGKKPSPSTPAANANDKPGPDKPSTDKPPDVARNLPPRIVIQEGGSSNPGSSQISVGSSHDETAHSQATTGQLLDSTDTNLRNIKRQLSADEQSMVAQIRDYQSQARQAVKDGDMVRAHNLALKAHLLSDELVKQR